ncbi:MAG TPA: hypothetical protein VJI52_04570 [Candidatus Nanoarchaeia archaeon]|nr:hypothetical protein [Candidatus Nanoarchaeia archaeon]
MAEEDDGFVSYKNISDLKKELETIQDRKDVSPKELYEAVHRLADTVGGMLEVFGAAAEQMKLEDKGYEAEAKKHENIISKLDKLIDQNKTIAEGMVAIVELVKEKMGSTEREEPSFPKEDAAPMFKPKPEPKSFPKPEWKPDTSMQRPQTMGSMAPPSFQQMPQSNFQMAPTISPPVSPTNLAPPSTDFGMQLPPMQPAPMPDLDFPDEPFPLDDDTQKKKGIFGMFKK